MAGISWNNRLPPNQPFILHLPDELLADIAQSAMQPRRWRESYDVATLSALSRVSRRFRRVATPYLYSQIEYLASSSFLNRMKLIHRALRENPALWPFCQDLLLDLSSYNLSTLYIPMDFATWLTASTSLYLSFGDESKATSPQTRSIVCIAFRHMLNLGQISWYGELHNNITLSSVCYLLDGLPCLKTLEISRIGRTNASSWEFFRVSTASRFMITPK